MNKQLCGWCITNRVRPEFLADRAADCPRCAEYRMHKAAVSSPSDCKKNAYHICDAGSPCKCECHRVDALMPRESVALPPKPQPKLVLRKRKPIHVRTIQS